MGKPDFRRLAEGALRGCRYLSDETTLSRVDSVLNHAFNAGLERAAEIADEWASPVQRQFGNGGPAAAIRAEKDKTNE